MDENLLSKFMTPLKGKALVWNCKKVEGRISLLGPACDSISGERSRTVCHHCNPSMYSGAWGIVAAQQIFLE